MNIGPDPKRKRSDVSDLVPERKRRGRDRDKNTAPYEISDMLETMEHEEVETEKLAQVDRFNENSLTNTVVFVNENSDDVNEYKISVIPDSIQPDGPVEELPIAATNPAIQPYGSSNISPIEIANSIISTEISADPDEMSAEVMNSADPEEISADPDEISEEVMNSGNVDKISADPDEISADPDEISADPDEISADPDEISADPDEISNVKENSMIPEISTAVGFNIPDKTSTDSTLPNEILTESQDKFTTDSTLSEVDSNEISIVTNEISPDLGENSVDEHPVMDTTTDPQEMYAKNADGDEIYENTTDKDKIFLIQNSKPIYAKKKNGDEYYPQINGADVLIETSDGYVYAKLADGTQMYPKDKDGNEIPIEKAGLTIYAKTSFGQEYYPRFSNMDEEAKGKYIRDANGFVEYPSDVLGYSKYPLNNSSDEYYLKNANGSFAFGTDPDGNQIYAKKQNGDEYYPEDDSIALSIQGSPKYALANDKKAFFLKDEHGNEKYLVHPKYNHAHVVFMDGNLLPNYAKTQTGDEMYPISCVGVDCKTTEELILNSTYAKTSDFYYPLDAFGNEYTIQLPPYAPINEKQIFPQGYPITNDNRIIIPNRNDKPYITDTMFPKVTEEDVIAKIFRKNNQYDFLTNKPSQRKSRSTRKAAYFTLPLSKPKFTTVKPESKYNFIWIALFVFIAILTAIMSFIKV